MPTVVTSRNVNPHSASWNSSPFSNFDLQVFGMAISTILQCFIADEEMFARNDRFGEGDLADLLDKASSEAAAKSQDARVVTVEMAGGDNSKELP